MNKYIFICPFNGQNKVICSDSFEGNRAWGGALKLINSSAFSCLPHHHMYLYWQYLHHRSLIGILPALCCSCVLQSFLWKLVLSKYSPTIYKIFKWIIFVSTIRHILGLIHPKVSCQLKLPEYLIVWSSLNPQIGKQIRRIPLLLATIIIIWKRAAQSQGTFLFSCFFFYFWTDH